MGYLQWTSATSLVIKWPNQHQIVASEMKNSARVKLISFMRIDVFLHESFEKWRSWSEVVQLVCLHRSFLTFAVKEKVIPKRKAKNICFYFDKFEVMNLARNLTQAKIVCVAVMVVKVFTEKDFSLNSWTTWQWLCWIKLFTTISVQFESLQSLLSKKADVIRGMVC